MTALPSLYLTTGEHLEHDRWASRPAVDSLNDLRMCAYGWLSHFTVFSFFQLRGWVPLFFSFHPIMRAMSVLSSNNCLAFSLSHHWGTLGTLQIVSKTTSRLLEWLWCVHVCGCHILLYFLLSHRWWVPLCLFHPKCVQSRCSVVMIALPSLYLTPGEHLDHDRKWVRLPHDSLNDCGVCMCVVVTSCFISFCAIGGEFHCSFHFTR